MRKTYIDNTRSLVILLVLLYHVIYIFCGVVPGVLGPITTTRWQESYMYFVYPWFMTVLFLISGMCSRWHLETHSAKEFKTSRTRKLLVPSTLGILIFGWIQGWINMSIGGAFENGAMDAPKVVVFLIMCLSGTGVLWFIQLLWIYSMLLLLVRKMEKDRLYAKLGDLKLPGIIILSILGALSTKVLNTPIIAVYRCGIYAFYFFIGYFIFSQEKNMETISSAFFPFLAAALLLGIAEVYCYWGANYAEAPIVNSFLSGFYAYFGSLALLGGMRRFASSSTPFFSYLSKKNWYLYVFHYLPLSAVGLFLTRKTTLPGIVIYLLVTAASVLGALLLGEVTSRIPVVRYLLLGIKKEKKHV